MLAEVITVGDELLIGQVVDTNSAWIGKALNKAGIRLFQISSVSDAATHINAALAEALARVDVVIMTGGLGPTRDDITKKVLADFFGQPLVRHQPTFDHVKAMLARRGVDFNRLNQAQADVPAGCRVLHNVYGTAPGMWFEHHGKVVVSLPGVPSEMKHLMEHAVLPDLAERYRLPDVVHKTMLTFGLPESELAERIANWEEALPESMGLAYLPGVGGIRLRLSVYGGDREATEQRMQAEAESLRALLGEYFVNAAEETLESTVGNLLRQHGVLCAVAESCTGGLLASRLTATAGASDYFAGGVVAYSNQMKEQLLGVPPELFVRHGAVSREVVEAMALGICRVSGAAYGLATSGIAGPGGGSEEKPVGTVWIACAGPLGVHSEQCLFGGDRGQIMTRTSTRAINALRLMLPGVRS